MAANGEAVEYKADLMDWKYIEEYSNKCSERFDLMEYLYSIGI